MNILITGATSGIGKEIVKVLIAPNAPIFSLFKTKNLLFLSLSYSKGKKETKLCYYPFAL